jgi:hypothetical protein
MVKGSRTNGKRTQAAKSAKAVKAVKAVKAGPRAARGKPAAKTRPAGAKPAAPKTASPTPARKKVKARLSLVPPPRPAKPSPGGKKSKRNSPSDPVTKPHAMRPELELPLVPKRTKPLTATEKRRAAYDSEVLAVLREESSTKDVAGSDAQIRRRLREKSLGSFEPARVATLRRFKDALQSELSSGPQSGHFTSTHGLYANPEDFDHGRLIRDYTRSFPTLSPEAIAGFIPLAVYFYYLR